jgi:transcription elongation factor Elf1
MVHYAPTLTAVHRPPPICPKCGSHRTQVVGLSDNGQTVVIRCNACGERSEVKTGDETSDVASDSRLPLSL